MILKYQYLGLFLLTIFANILIAINMQYTAQVYHSINSPNFYNIQLFIVIIFLSFLSFLLIINSKKNPSSIIGGVLFFTVLVPFFYFLHLENNFSFENFYFHLILVLFSFYLFKIIADSKIKISFIRTINFQSIFLEYFLFSFMLFGCFLLIYSFGESMSFSFFDIYDRRIETKTEFSQNRLLNYYNSLFAGLMVPFAAIYAAARNKYIFFFLSIFSSIICFGVFGGKGVLLSPFLAFFFTKFFLLLNLNGYKFLLICITIFCIFCLIEIFLISTGYLNLYFFRRMFYVPAKLSFWYFEYFSNNQLFYMSDSIFGQFFTSNSPDYDKARTIGGNYLGNYQSHANSNIWSSAYADFGFIGIPIFSMLAGLITKFINEVYKIKQSIIIIVYSFFVGLVWAQTSLNTSLLSNGIFFGILLMLFVPKEQNLKKSEI